MLRRPDLFALALLVLPAQAVFADAPPTAVDEAAVAAPAAAQVVAAEPQVEDSETEAGKACLVAGGDDLLAGLQPEWMNLRSANCGCKDQCRRDRDCKKVCGPLGGECVMVNSCCTECWCFG